MPNRAQYEAEVTVTDENQFSNAVFLKGDKEHHFTAVVHDGTFSLTPSIQISSDNSTWTDFDLNNFSAMSNSGGERSGTVYGEWYVRVGVATGNHTSGSATMFIKRGFG